MSSDKPLIPAQPTYQYNKGELNEKEVNADPLVQFQEWFSNAQSELVDDSSLIPESATFSTARLPSGRVSSRIVLLKELDSTGFVIYSNWNTSKKTQDIETNKYASLTFFWPHLQRQVRVEGRIESVTREKSQAYFETRPRGSKIGAWASPQSEVIASRNALEGFNKDFEEKFATLGEDIPIPSYWGGVRLVPLEIEFWQGGNSRLHDRLTYRREDVEGGWELFRLAP